MGEVDAVAVRLRERLAHARPDLDRWQRYYEGRQPLEYLAPELMRELAGRVRPVIVHWPQLVVDAVEERLDVEGFRQAGDTDRRLWDWWQANDLDEASQMAHVEALVARRAYVIVGAGDSRADAPVITVESAEQVVTEHDPRTRRVVSALKTWVDADKVVHEAVYLPDSTTHRVGGGSGGWEVVSRDDHRLGVVPVVPLVNRPRVLDLDGRSELEPVVPLSDAACKIATDMMVAAEFHAIPRLVALGLSEDDFTDSSGRPVSKWERIAGRIWRSEAPPSEADVKQLPAADLRNFHDTMNSLARLVASMAGLPPHFLGYSDANPASADAIRSAETRLVKRAERKQRAFGGAWERVMRLASLVADGELPAGSASLEVVWRDAATPTRAQAADAAVKLHAAGVVPLRQTRADLGYSPQAIGLMEVEDSRAVDRVLAGDFASLLGPKPDQPVG